MGENGSNADNAAFSASNPREFPLGSDGLTYPIGFIEVSSNADNGNAVGGMLVTDNSGIPLEFMITTAVKPSRAQRALYGDRLRSFVSVELCAKELLLNIRTQPHVMFIRDPVLWGIMRNTSTPILLLERSEPLGSKQQRPVVSAPPGKPEFEMVIEPSSLHMDMMEVFDRIEKCRQLLATEKPEYRI